MILVFTNSKGRYLSDSVVDSNEVGILRELGDDFTRAYPLSLTRYHGDRHEALFGGRVHTVGTVRGSFVSLPVALTLGVLVVVGFSSGCISRQLIC
jgi:hypothetical protein